MRTGIDFQFNALDISEETLVWTANTGGRMNEANHWLQKRIPDRDPVFVPALSTTSEVSVTTQNTVLRRLECNAPLLLAPRSELTVLEAWITRGLVVVSHALAIVESTGRLDARLEISGGTFYCKDATSFGGGLGVLRGGQFILEGTRASLTPVTAFSGNAFTFSVRNGATKQLPQFTDYTDTGDFNLFRPTSTSFSAAGGDSRLTLPELTQVRGPVNWKVSAVPSLTLEATAGAGLELPKLSMVHDRTRIRSVGPKSALLAPQLDAIHGPVSDFPSTVDVFESGQLRLAGKTVVTRCQVRMDSGGRLQCNDLEIDSTASLAGSGTLVGSLRNLGKVSLNSLPNTLVVEGDLELESSSVLETTIALWNGKVQAGRLEIRGGATLNGTLKLVVPNRSVLRAGDEYVILETTNPLSGEFTSLDDSALGNELKAERILLPSGLRLKISPR